MTETETMSDSYLESINAAIAKSMSLTHRDEIVETPYAADFSLIKATKKKYMRDKKTSVKAAQKSDHIENNSINVDTTNLTVVVEAQAQTPPLTSTKCNTDRLNSCCSSVVNSDLDSQSKSFSPAVSSLAAYMPHECFDDPKPTQNQQMQKLEQTLDEQKDAANTLR